MRVALGMTRVVGRLVVALVALVGCAGPSPTLDDGTFVAVPHPTPGSACADVAEAPDAAVLAFFHCRDEPDADPRPVARPAGAVDPVTRLEAALVGLLGGPTAAEREAGFVSPFSQATQLVGVRATIDADGSAVVDLGDVRDHLPSLTADESRAVVAQLAATAFGIEEVSAVEFRIEGSCDDFREWVGASCDAIERSDWERRSSSSRLRTA